MKSSHVHIFGAKGRQPASGDYCLTCPTGWRRGISGYHTDSYKPRTKRLLALIAEAESATMVPIDDPGSVSPPRGPIGGTRHG